MGARPGHPPRAQKTRDFTCTTFGMVLISLSKARAHRLVDGDQGDGVAALEVAAEVEGGDVDAVLAEQRAQRADEARLVVVVDVEHARQNSASTSMPLTSTMRGLRRR